MWGVRTPAKSDVTDLGNETGRGKIGVKTPAEFNFTVSEKGSKRNDGKEVRDMWV